MSPTASTSTERMRLTRDRKKQGFVAVYVELHQNDIAGLIRAGLLAEVDRWDRTAIAVAMGRALDAMPHSADGATLWPAATAGAVPVGAIVAAATPPKPATASSAKEVAVPPVSQPVPAPATTNAAPPAATTVQPGTATLPPATARAPETAPRPWAASRRFNQIRQQ